MFRQFLKKSIHKSQHCNRNWDLSKSIPKEDVDLIVESATQCPVKQNLNFYKTHVITDRDKIEKIHSKTEGFFIDGGCHTNSQTLANLIIAFTEDEPKVKRDWNREFDEETNKWVDISVDVESDTSATNVDRQMAVGIASGYVNLVSTMLGYETGCCKCFDGKAISKELNGEAPLLLMGIGYPDTTRNRLEHHKNTNVKFPSLKNKREVVIHA